MLIVASTFNRFSSSTNAPNILSANSTTFQGEQETAKTAIFIPKNQGLTKNSFILELKHGTFFHNV